MKRTALLVIIAIDLTGCVEQHMNEGLRALVGQDIQMAVNRLGYPDGKREILGKTIYVWSASHSAVLPMASTSTTYGQIGGVPVYGTSTNMNFVPANFNCTIQLAVGSNNTIETWQWSGNMGGCQPYARALTR